MKTELIERINSYLNKYQSFNPQPANDKDIKQAEVMLNVVFDSDYKQFIKNLWRMLCWGGYLWNQKFK